MMSAQLGCIIEFDGMHHFRPIRGEEVLRDTQRRDRELEDAVLRQDLTLIRVSYDQHSYKSGGSFSEECMNQLFGILRDLRPGVFKIGSAYSEVQTTGRTPYDESEGDTQ
jgi:hypothetical protein